MATPMVLILLFDNGNKFGLLHCLFRLTRTNSKMSNPHFSFYKIQSNNLNHGYPNILTNQINFCFSKLYFSPLIRTKIEYINKQLVIDVNWPNKAFWKSALNKATKYILLFEKSF